MKCPLLKKLKNIETCGFNSRKYRGDCPLLVEDDGTGIECFELSDKDYNRMLRYV